MKVQNKTRFKLIPICSKLTSTMIINISLKGLINSLHCHAMKNKNAEPFNTEGLESGK